MSTLLKSPMFYASLVLTLLGLLASNGVLGSGELYKVAGYLGTLLILVGVHVLKPAPATA